MKNVFSTILFLCCLFFSKAQDSLIVYFSFDSYRLSSTATQNLKSISIENLKSIYGYTDKHGNEQYNKSLAKRRINAVINYLNIQKNKEISKFPIGEEFLTSNVDKENRKVVLFFTSDSTDINKDRPKVKTEEIESINSQIKTAKTGDKITLKSLNFQPGLDILLPESSPVLKELLLVLQQNNTLNIEIHGHICCTSEDYEDLSTARAKTVYNYLVQNGISSDRLSYKGFGVSQPLYTIPEQNSEEQIANRRVEIKVVSN
jgi:outer membrane protein OmpA-like peptidoglycan-associated protein